MNFNDMTIEEIKELTLFGKYNRPYSDIKETKTVEEDGKPTTYHVIMKSGEKFWSEDKEMFDNVVLGKARFELYIGSINNSTEQMLEFNKTISEKFNKRTNVLVSKLTNNIDELIGDMDSKLNGLFDKYDNKFQILCDNYDDKLSTLATDYNKRLDVVATEVAEIPKSWNSKINELKSISSSDFKSKMKDVDKLLETFDELLK